MSEETLIQPAEHSSDANITFESPIIDDVEPHISFMEDSKTGSEKITIIPKAEPIIHKLTYSGSGPIANYYTEIHWGHGFEQWPLVRFSTPLDGSCLFHAISNSFFAPYHTELLNGEHVSRNRMVAALRRELSQMLAANISNGPNAPIHYDSLNGGNNSDFAKDIPEFSLQYMQNQLDSNCSIGYGYMEFIGNALNKDIYILEACRYGIYATDELPFTIKGNRNSIVLYYMNGHYELVGVHNENGSFSTHFAPEHSFIRFLYGLVQEFLTNIIH